MAVETSSASSPLITKIVTDTDSDTTVEIAAGANAELFFVEITNPNTVAVYTKLIASASGSSSTTQHYMQLYCPANTTCYMYVPTSVPLSSGIEFYTSTGGGIAAGQTTPTEDVIVKIGWTPT
tara:strand:+ start:594 stop:962 length:369 start_codon:yes stop_codon:yes gene_type:complete